MKPAHVFRPGDDVCSTDRDENGKPRMRFVVAEVASHEDDAHQALRREDGVWFDGFWFEPTEPLQGGLFE